MVRCFAILGGCLLSTLKYLSGARLLNLGPMLVRAEVLLYWPIFLEAKTCPTRLVILLRSEAVTQLATK